MVESTDRAAWTQYEEQGRGSGLNAYKHKQPGYADKNGNLATEKHRRLIRDYYTRSDGCA